MVVKTLNQFTVPKEPDIIHTYPALSTWPFYILQNRNILCEKSLHLQEYRNELISLAIDYTKCLTGKKFSWDSKTPIIATGHQLNWHHCGIFVKSLIGYHLAQKMNGLFIYVALDHDIIDTNLVLPKKKSIDSAKLSLLYLNGHESTVPLERIRFDHQTIWNFLVQCNDISLQNALLKEIWGINSLDSIVDKSRSISDCIVYLLELLYQSLGVNMLYLPVSRMSDSYVFQNFCADYFLNAVSFVRHYNDAISAAKGFSGISTLRTKTIQGQAFMEFPLWLLTPENKRETLWVNPNAGNAIMIASEIEILAAVQKTKVNLLFQILKQKGYSMRPKAVLLTHFLRLYLCDWFIHGIGGRHYESISDYLLNHYCQVSSLSYGLASLTSYLFKNKHITIETDLDRLSKQHRKFIHKPELLLNPDQCHNSKVHHLIEKKRTLIVCSGDQALPTCERETIWQRIKEINQELQALLPYSQKSVLSDMGKLKEQLAVFQKRDFFFGLFSKERLNSFSEVINAQL